MAFKKFRIADHLDEEVEELLIRLVAVNQVSEYALAEMAVTSNKDDLFDLFSQHKHHLHEILEGRGFRLTDFRS